ncbi:cysteine dioxygenase family protein [Halobacillus shinanisalinarum]|uniref:Cysteine dioxygenase family protein n=1 Tax=Halobacillus shinanisalinarum TaxID=2932258 RepID=A0ABY4GYJ6_9BACI|nr:cysteine dioxygenase family protein [Halobacillus shinanisalinarum]UOQ93154.1 cysteine dioxygenase family protein [Halobacillus shinanisalinarum]
MGKIQQQYELSDFISEMTKVVEETTESAERVREAERLLCKLIRTKSWLSQEKLQTENSQYARHSLYRDPKNQFEVLALIWEPGQCTPLHDHDGTWGVEGVVSGRMRVKNYVQLESFSDHTAKLCYAGAMTVNEQSTGELLPPADCHILEPHGDETTVTIHVYGKQLRKFRVFEAPDEKGFIRLGNNM